MEKKVLKAIKTVGYCKISSGRSVVRSSRLVWDQEVAGSNPAAPTRGYEQSSPFFFILGLRQLLLVDESKRIKFSITCSTVRRGGSNARKATK